MRSVLHRPTVDPADVIGAEWADMTWSARLLVRIASPDMAKAARYLSQHQRHVVQVPHTRPTQAGPATRWADKLFASAGH